MIASQKCQTWPSKGCRLIVKGSMKTANGSCEENIKSLLSKKELNINVPKVKITLINGYKSIIRDRNVFVKFTVQMTASKRFRSVAVSSGQASRRKAHCLIGR